MSMSLPGPIPGAIKAGQVGGGVWRGRYLGVRVGVHSRVGFVVPPQWLWSPPWW
jgi:hypothetical protein